MALKPDHLVFNAGIVAKMRTVRPGCGEFGSARHAIHRHEILTSH
jgi:hypothetical protein